MTWLMDILKIYNNNFTTRITGSDKILHDKISKIAKNSKYDGYQIGLASVVCSFFDKKYFCQWYQKREYFIKS